MGVQTSTEWLIEQIKDGKELNELLISEAYSRNKIEIKFAYNYGIEHGINNWVNSMESGEFFVPSAEKYFEEYHGE